MKLGLIADIHGNAQALAAVLAAAEKAGVDRLLVAGDLVGYYFAPADVLAQLAAWEMHVVRGNHEEMLAAARRDPGFLDAVGKRYGSGLEVALGQLNEKQLEWLCELPHPLHLDIEGCRILLCHGSPPDVDRYIYPDAPADLLKDCDMPGIDIVVTGHTHYPMEHRLTHSRLVNPGSVGQPRDRRPGAQWAILDTAGRTVEFRTERYDCADLVRECRQRHPELPYLADVLLRTA